MILIKRLDADLKKPKEKLVALFRKTSEIDETTDTIVQEEISLMPESWDKETANAIKRLLRLPLTKDLFFYKKTKGNWEKHSITDWFILEEYDEWCTLRIHVENLGFIDIHHAFLSEMQRPNFIDEYEQSIKNIAD